ncbi:MAG: Bax inhibitor-1/YccA family protein [Clostridiales bacterium]|nr:Bax inhibitor-1/YccA family protein [Clostridiales bacterium]
MSELLQNKKANMKTNTSILQANPILRKLSKVTERSEDNCASYHGIALKTCFFLIATLFGMVLQLILQNTVLAGQPIWSTFKLVDNISIAVSKLEVIILGSAAVIGFVSQLFGIFARRSIPVSGTIYSVCQGYFISFLVFRALGDFGYLGIEALILTVVVIGVMSWLYTSGRVRANGKFRVILLSLIIGSIALSLLMFLGSLIPMTRGFVLQLMHNTGLMIAVDVIGILIASLFLISDFDMIDTCVKENYPREYEWSASFGLVFTVIWLYMKILDLLITLAGKKKD